MKDRLFDVCRDHAQQLFQAARWLIFFALVYAAFLTALFAVQEAQERSNVYLRNNPLFSANIGRETWRVFPLGVRLEQVTLHLKQGVSANPPPVVVLQEVTLGVSLAGLFPPCPRLRLDVTGLGGTLTTTLTPDTLTQPQSVQIAANWKHLSLPLLLTTLLPEGGRPKPEGSRTDGVGAWDLIRLNTGTLTGSLTGVFPLARPLDGNGTLHMELAGVNAALTLPFLRPETLEQVAGQADLHWKGEIVTLENFALRNAIMQSGASGSLKVRPNNLATPDMSLTVSLALDPEQLRLELLPPRTRAAFETRHQATVRISGTPAAPIFALE